MNGNIGVDPTVQAGSDSIGHALLYTPVVVAPGSTISHWDTAAYPNQLMEPFVNDDLTHSVKPPEDLTLPLLRDIGWFADADVDGLSDSSDGCVHSDRRATVFVAGATTGVTNVLFTTGCTIADLVAAEEEDARNHGQFVSGLNHLTRALMDAGVITKQERDRLHGAAAHATAP